MADEEYRVQYAKAMRPHNDLDALIAGAKAAPHDPLPRMVLADYLEERGLHADDATLAHLRSGNPDGWIHQIDGKVHAGPSRSIDEIRDRMTADGSHWFDRSTMRFFGTKLPRQTFSGPGGTFFVTSEQPPHGGRRHTVRWYDPVNNDISTVGQFAHDDARTAGKEARRLSGMTADAIYREHAVNDDKRYMYRYFLEKNGRHADDETLHVLSTHHGPISIEDTPDGKVRVRPKIGE